MALSWLLLGGIKSNRKIKYKAISKRTAWPTQDNLKGR